MLVTKECKICLVIKSTDEFPRRSLVCKKCTSKHTLEYYKKRYNDIVMKGEGYCKHCNRLLPSVNFSSRNTFCIDCERLKGKKYIKKIYIKAKLKQSNVTIQQYEELVKKADNKCMICKRIPERRLVIDHCHTSNKMRGLLCYTCNIGLGYFKDSTEILLNALVYLKGNLF